MNEEKMDFKLIGIISTAVLLIITSIALLIMTMEKSSTEERVLEDVVGYIHLSETLPITEEKSSLVSISKLYGNEVPKAVKRYTDMGYSFFFRKKSEDSYEIKMHRNVSIQNVTLQGHVLSWEAKKKNARLYEWKNGEWVNLSDIQESKYRYAKEEAYYGIQFKSSFKRYPILPITPSTKIK